MMTVGGVLAKRIRRVSPPRISTSSSLTILTICWAGVQRAGNFDAERTFADAAGELADHGHGDVGVEEGAPDLADGGVDVRLGEAALATEILEGCCQPVRE